EIQTTQDQEQQTYSKYLDDKEYGSEDLVQSILDGTYKSNRTEGVNNDQIEQSDNNETLATSNEDASAIEYNSDKETEDKLFEPNSHTKENISKEEPIEPASNEKNIFDHINDFNQFLASEKTSNTDVDQLKQAPFTPIDKPDTRESDFTETNEFDEKTTPSTTPIPDLFTEETSITNDNQFKEESFTLTDKPDTGEHNFSEANEFNEKITPSITPIPVSSTEETSITNDDEFKKESFTLTGKPDTVLQDFTETNEFDEKITLSRTPIPDLSTTLEKSIPPANQSTGRIPPVKSKSYKTESILMLTAITIVVIIFIFSDINNKETTDNKTTNNLLRDQIHYQSSEKNNVLEKQTEELSKSSYRSNETNKKRENIYNPESSYSAHTILNKETKAQNNYETPPPAYFETSQEDEKSGESLNDKAGSSNTEPSVAQNDINQEVTTDKETAQTYLESQESSESARKEIDEIEPSMQVHTDVSPEEYSDTTQTYLESQASSASTRKKIHGIESSMQVNPDVSPAKYSDTDQSRTVTLSDAEKTYSGENTAIESSTPASHGMDTANYNSTIRTETDSLEHFVDSNIEIAEIEVINQFETEIDTTPTDEKNDAMHDKPAPHSIMHNSSLLQGKPYYWALNLSSIYNAKEPADEVIKSLRNKNIPAEIKQILIEKKVWYRIRIRGFENKQQAIDYMDIIKENTDIRKYWVSKITPGPDSDKPGNPSIMSQ
ncbi:MAG: SPOR domain-containing protein, partial [Gammaproteobacteria bacterium]|nr:SPOR domain-containing protein [Gammaproteobacteria bacterium]